MRTGGEKHKLLIAKAVEKIIAENHQDIHKIIFEKGFNSDGSERNMTMDISMGYFSLHKIECIPDAFVYMRKRKESPDETGAPSNLKNILVEAETNPAIIAKNEKKMQMYSIIRSTRIALKLILVVERGAIVSEKVKNVFHEVWEMEI